MPKCCSATRSSWRRYASSSRILLAMVFVLLSGCITSIDRVVIRDLFADPEGTQLIDRTSVTQTAFIGYTVEFTLSDSLEESLPQPPSSRIITTFTITDSSGYAEVVPFGIIFSGLYPPGDYKLVARSSVNNLVDTGDASSEEFLLHIGGSQPPPAPRVLAPGPQGGGDGGMLGAGPSGDPAPPDLCNSSVPTGLAVAADGLEEYKTKVPSCPKSQSCPISSPQGENAGSGGPKRGDAPG